VFNLNTGVHFNKVKTAIFANNNVILPLIKHRLRLFLGYFYGSNFVATWCQS
jgi:hypothetical protein